MFEISDNTKFGYSKFTSKNSKIVIAVRNTKIIVYKWEKIPILTRKINICNVKLNT